MNLKTFQVTAVWSRDTGRGQRLLCRYAIVDGTVWAIADTQGDLRHISGKPAAQNRGLLNSLEGGLYCVFFRDTFRRHVGARGPATAGLHCVGEGLTVYRDGGHKPGTIHRVSATGRCIWYSIDAAETDGTDQVQSDVHRAIRGLDGVYRDDRELWRIALDVKRPAKASTDSAYQGGDISLDALEEEVERLEPYLLRKRWYPMTSMTIPSVLQHADALISSLTGYSPVTEEESKRHSASLQRLLGLRRNFRREVPLAAEERARLSPAYCATTFVAELPTGPVRIRVGAEHPGLKELCSGGQEWAYITAENPHSAVTPSEENLQRQAALKRELDARGVRFFPGVSEPDDGSEGEASFLALLSRDVAIDLGRRFQQNAIVAGSHDGRAELIWLR
jgi:hypothetical protein